jgi:hypothetical protein
MFWNAFAGMHWSVNAKRGLDHPFAHIGHQMRSQAILA